MDKPGVNGAPAGCGARFARCAAAICIAACCAAGCAETAPRPLPRVAIDFSGVEPNVDYADLAAVLEKAVDEDGMILPKDAAACSDRLDAQLKKLAATGPTITPQLLPAAEDRLAYWYNARAAWSLKLALLRELPQEISAAELEDRPFTLDGRAMTLRDIDAVLAEQAGWQVLAAAPGVLLQRAALPAKPMAPGDVRRRITERLNQFIRDPKRFVVDIEQKRILFPPALWRCRQELLECHRRACGAEQAILTTALLPHVSGPAHRRLQDAMGYACLPASPSRVLAVKKPSR